MDLSTSEEFYQAVHHAEQTFRKMESYLKQQQLCDVILIVGNRKIPAHRFLCAKSFCKMTGGLKQHEISPPKPFIHLQKLLAWRREAFGDTVSCSFSLTETSQCSKSRYGILRRQPWLVLSSVSDYFAAMFTNDVCEAKQEEIKMEGIDPGALWDLVQFAYTGQKQDITKLFQEQKSILVQDLRKYHKGNMPFRFVVTGAGSPHLSLEAQQDGTKLARDRRLDWKPGR
ncbi:Kelch-like protein 1, partial [Ophiophagus hannah]